MTIKKVAVIGSGIMGSGIAQVAAQAGYDVVMIDLKQEFIDRGINIIKESLGKFTKKKKITQDDADEIVARIHTSTNMKDAVGDVDYVIEAVFERANVKLPIFEQLEEACPERVIFASNTSGIPVSLLSSATKRPDKVIGLHFINPVPVMRSIETIKTLVTSEETLKITLDFAASLGKKTVVVKDSPGFVVNRISAIVINEGAKLLEEGLATLEDIDELMRLSLNWPMGPFQLADLVGIDVSVDLLEQIYQQTGWERYKPTPLLKRMREVGHIGRKSGKGFYEWA
ncbi:MAG: 3-hydroxyacyl-CoA dehydrogenase family protein [Dehalococcoidia bacterium]|nr:3-hydroxyacyl-CoA dehydrogenase family protein [Dehalococcoidia bacterium]